MTKRWIAFVRIVCLGIFLLLCGQTADLRSEEAKTDTEETSFLQKKEAEDLVERSILISIPQIFKDLERPPVKFKHDKHALALEKEGCEECHPKDEKGKIIFVFPKNRDENDRENLMNAYHDTCIACHNERSAKGEKKGAVTCGECHAIEEDYHRIEYLPIMPTYYDVLRDTYHGECTACHKEPEKKVEDAGALDWQGFYINEKKKIEETWPAVVFDYYLHDKHEQALEKNQCEPCHFISPQEKKRLDDEGKEPTCRDWLKEKDEEQDLTEQKAAHSVCIGCHLERKDENKEAGPIYCKECHSARERTAGEMADVPRTTCEQEEKILILIDKDARMKAVPFNHKSHEGSSRSCQACHHDTLNACKTCHPLKGVEEGDFITLAEAYHDIASQWSCIGCHETEKKKQECAGCHHLMRSGLSEVICSSCHSGSLESLDNVTKLGPPENYLLDDLAEEMEISVLENEYELSKFPHLAIVKKLTDISNNNKLAQYFHSEVTDFCSGCHHYSDVKEKENVPSCSTCHTVRKEPQKSTPTLLGAYHRQCLGCHKQMGGTEEKMPQDCAGCHEEKQKTAVDKNGNG